MSLTRRICLSCCQLLSHVLSPLVGDPRRLEMLGSSEPRDFGARGDSLAIEASEESMNAPLGQVEGRLRCRRSTPIIDVPSGKEDMVVASLTLFETMLEPSPRLEVGGPSNIPLAEDIVRAIGPINASGVDTSKRQNLK